MAVAQIYPEPARLKRAGSTGIIEQAASPQYVSFARTVLRFTPEAVPVVMSGAISLDAAYQEAKAKRERAELESTKLEEAATRLACYRILAR